MVLGYNQLPLAKCDFRKKLKIRRNAGGEGRRIHYPYFAKQSHCETKRS